MKKIFCLQLFYSFVSLRFFLLLIICLAGVACNKNEPVEEMESSQAIVPALVGEIDNSLTYSAKEERIEINENEFISWRILPEKGFLNSPPKMILENHTNGFLMDNIYTVEYFDQEKWSKIELNFNYVMSASVLLPGTTEEGSFGFLSEKYFYKAGKYRMIKHVSLFSSNFPDSFENLGAFILTVEFVIK
jgi:hypothetical protein